MAIAKRLMRQANTCAELAAATYDEESRERYLRLEELYRLMAAGEDADDKGMPRPEGASESSTYRLS